MFDAVHPGYHVNKRHWNAMLLDGSIPRGEVERVIERSDARVVKRLREVERVALDVRHGKGALYR